MPLYRSGLFFHNLWDTCDPEVFTDEPIIERGTIVKIKPEWLNPGESGQMHYVVVKEYDENRILIQALGTGLSLAPTEAVEKSMVYLCGYVTLNDQPTQNHERIHRSTLQTEELRRVQACRSQD